TQSPATNLITTIVTNSNPYDLVNPHLTSTNQFAVIVKEVNVAPSLPMISTQIVNELTLLTVTNTATNANIHSTITGYRLVSPPTNMVINASGVITWTPAQAQSPGTNTITTVVTNSNPYDLVNPQLMATNQFTVIVKEVNIAPVLPVIPTQTVNAQALLTVTNTATETNIHATLGYAFVSPPLGMSISTNGIITWTPTRSQGPGTNIITTVVTNTDSFDTANPHLSATNSFTIIIYAPTLAPIGNYTVNAGQIVTLTATATDNDSTRTMTFSLFAPPTGATLNPSSGLFSWRPGVAAANTTNTVQVIVTDNSTPPLSDTKSFTITVNPLASVILTPLGYTNGQFKLQISGTTGPDYIIMTSGSLTNWTDLTTNLSPTTPFQYTDTNALSSTNRFYRVRLSP
ncbi:MAG TPA: putative Ig domain-containing protein, partial [Verrucomicrobiae bacterium]